MCSVLLLLSAAAACVCCFAGKTRQTPLLLDSLRTSILVLEPKENKYLFRNPLESQVAHVGRTTDGQDGHFEVVFGVCLPQKKRRKSIKNIFLNEDYEDPQAHKRG